MSETSELHKYQKYTDREHILKKPDTYIGSIERSERNISIDNMEKIANALSVNIVELLR